MLLPATEGAIQENENEFVYTIKMDACTPSFLPFLLNWRGDSVLCLGSSRRIWLLHATKQSRTISHNLAQPLASKATSANYPSSLQLPCFDFFFKKEGKRIIWNTNSEEKKHQNDTRLFM